MDKSINELNKKLARTAGPVLKINKKLYKIDYKCDSTSQKQWTFIKRNYRKIKVRQGGFFGNIFGSLVRVVWRLIKNLLIPSVKSVWKS